MAQVAWSDQAVKDLEQIYRFIARDSSVAAELTIERIRDATRRLLQFPKSGRLFPKRQRAMRERSLHRRFGFSTDSVAKTSKLLPCCTEREIWEQAI